MAVHFAAHNDIVGIPSISWFARCNTIAHRRLNDRGDVATF